ERTFEFGFSVLKGLYEKGIIGLNQNYQKNQSDGSYLITLLKNNVRTEVSTATLLTPSSALSQASERIVANKSVRTDILISVIKDRITPNVILDERFTDELEKQAVENVSVTRGMVQKGELIIENGNVVGENVYQKLESLKQSYEENAKMRGDRKQVFLGQFLAVGLVITLLMV